MFTLGELADMLNGMIEDGANPDETVIIGVQPSYPLASKVANVAFDEETGKVVIAAGESREYGDSEWWG